MTELLGKEETSVAKVTERTKPTLVAIGKKQIISNGRWNDELMADWVCLHAKDKYVEIGKLAAVLGANTIPNKKRVRARLPRLYQELLKRGEILVTEYNGSNRSASAVKIADYKASIVDKQAVHNKLNRMLRTKEITADHYDKAIKVLLAIETAV